MPKIIAINSSKRKMNTYGVIEQVKKILNNNDINVEIINLFDYDIKSCLGCENCLIPGFPPTHNEDGGLTTSA